MVERRCLGYLMVGGGMLLLLSMFFNIWMLLWPFAIIAFGGMFLKAAISNTPTSYMAIPGMMIVGTGLIFLFQSMTNHWASWAYAWTLYPVFLGIAFVFVGERDENNLAQVGRTFISGGLLFFTLSGLFIEVLFFNSVGGVGLVALSLGMLVGGYVLLSSDRALLGRSKPKRKLKNNEHPAIY